MMKSVKKGVRSVFSGIRRRHSFVFVTALFIFFVVASVLFLLRAPSDFPVAERIEIPHGYSLIESVQLLGEENVVRSPLLLQIFLLTQFAGSDVKAGVYYFNRTFSTPEIAHAIVNGLHGAPPVRVTIHEGLRNEQIAEILAERIEGITEEDFLAASEGKEGFLFPETYFIPDEFTAEEFVTLMEEIYEERVGPLRPLIEDSGFSENEIITLASILEREANTMKSKQLVAGILFERLRIGMPLQVDAAFEYFLDKSSADLTFDDLEIESPYNTYRNTGLPPTPIANPGIISIEAALNPVTSEYLYYLTATDGTFHYAKTFEEHKQNKARYLP